MKGHLFIVSILSLVTAQNPGVDFEPTSAETRIRMGPEFNVSQCQLSEAIREEIKGYAGTVSRMFAAIQGTGAFVGRTYKDLGYFVDKFGSRLAGSESLEKSIDFMVQQLEGAGLLNVHTENATVPHWARGDEKAELINPRKKSLAVMALGLSVPTPKEGLTADVIVVDSLSSLNAQKEAIKGKILVYCGPNSGFALFGASLAAQHGAVAFLTRSQSPMSLNTPHTGIQYYEPTLPKIPGGALSAEDADLIGRLAKRGEKLTIFLQLDVLWNNESQSRNVIGDLIGREIPGDMVLLSGHTDSWDVGQGAGDDAVGMMLALEVVNLLNHLQLTPRRTVRTVLWTGEELGLFGAKAWMVDHKTELSRYVAALESDFGCLKAMGYIFTGKAEVGCVLNEIRNLIPSSVNFSSLTQTKFMPTDVAYLAAGGVPSIVLNGNDGKYFWYHHTEADVLTTMDSKELDNCLAIWTATTFILADMSEKLPYGPSI